MDRPKVSVIVPVYNVESYIRECMDSLVHQTLQDIEIICVDDACSDSCPAILEEYAATDARVRVLHHEVNSGLSAARNSGMAIARAPYIMFCDSDDYYALDACEKMYAVIEAESEADMAMCAIEMVHNVDRGDERRFYDNLAFSVIYEGLHRLTAAILRNITNSVCAKIFRVDFLKRHQVQFPVGHYYEDAYFFYVCAAHARGVYFTKEKLYYYRRREDSIMRNTEQQNAKMGLDHLRIVLLLWDYYKKRGLLSLWGGFISELFARWLGYALFCAKKNKEITRQIMLMMREFVVREGFNSHNIPLHVVHQLQNARVGKRKYAFGLVKIREACWEKKVYVCGLRVWKKTRYLKIAESVFAQDSGYQMQNLSPYPAEDNRLLAELRSLGTFTYITCPGNMEDTMEMAAAINFFDTYHLPYNLSRRGRESGESIVFGGNGDLWLQNYNLAKSLDSIYAALQRAKRVVVLPISVQNCPAIIGLMDERFVVFCRERETYDILSSAHTKATLVLDHDMFLRMTDPFERPLSAKGVDYKPYLNYLFDLAFLPSCDTGYFLRQDRRSRGSVDAAGLDLADYFWGREDMPKNDMLFNVKFMLTMLDMYQNIVTDRLQVAVASARLGKQVYLVDDLYGINSSVYHHSLRVFSNVHLVEGLPDALTQSVRENVHETYCRDLLAKCVQMKDEIVSKELAALVH